MLAFLIAILLAVAGLLYGLSTRKPARVYLPIRTDANLRRRNPRR
jgi:hypothetical protein